MVDTGQMRREDTQFRLSQIAAAQKARGPHFALTNALPTRTNIISRKRDFVVFRLALRDGHAETLLKNRSPSCVALQTAMERTP